MRIKVNPKECLLTDEQMCGESAKNKPNEKARNRAPLYYLINV
jgi:hypothetical protein